MRCDECKHWVLDKDTYYNYSNTGECIKAKPLWDCSEWSDVTYERVLKPECVNMKFFVQDGSDYSAHLLTRADFYCAEFERK